MTDATEPRNYCSVSRSKPSFTIHIASPAARPMTVWELRQFLAAIDAEGIPDEAKLAADRDHNTMHFTGLRVSHTFSIEPAAEETDRD